MTKPVPIEYSSRLGLPVERGLNPAMMSFCEELHLVGSGCSSEMYDEKCMDCPFNPDSPAYDPQEET